MKYIATFVLGIGISIQAFGLPKDPMNSYLFGNLTVSEIVDYVLSDPDAIDSKLIVLGNEVWQITSNRILNDIEATKVNKKLKELSRALAVAHNESQEKSGVTAITKSIKKNDLETMAQIFDLLRHHTSYGYSSEELREKVFSFGPGRKLEKVRSLFAQAFKADIGSNTTGVRYTFNTGIADPDALPYSGKTIRATRHFGYRKPKIGSTSFNPVYERGIFHKSKFLLTPIDDPDARFSLLAPLRMDDNVIVMAASVGTQLNPSNYAADIDPWPGPIPRGPQPIVLLIGVRTDELDLSAQKNVKKTPRLNTEELIRYAATLEGTSVADLQKLGTESLLQMPAVYEYLYDQMINQILFDINYPRILLNLALRDMEGEVKAMVERAAATVPGYGKRVQQMFENGGMGVMQTRDGRQYFVRSLLVYVNYAFAPSIIDTEIPAFVSALVSPENKLQKIMRMPQNLPAVLEALKEMKVIRSTEETRDEISKAQLGAQRADSDFADLMRRLVTPSSADRGDCTKKLKNLGTDPGGNKN